MNDSRRRLEIFWTIDLMIGGIALLIYVLTLAPTITWRNEGADGGDLVTAAFTGGIPHPSGYPLYTMIAAFFAHLPVGEQAQNVGFFSALAGAGAVILVSRAIRSLLNASELRDQAAWIAPSTALVVAFAPALWSQSTLAETYSLNAFIATLLFTILLSDAPSRIVYAALVAGFGLVHHLSIVLLFPAAFVLLHARVVSSRLVRRAAMFLILPLAFYLYLPIRAIAEPPINWGDPKTLEGFWWTVSGTPYHSYLFNVLPGDVFARVSLTARMIFDNFSLVGVALGLWGLLTMHTGQGARSRQVGLSLILAFAFPCAYASLYASRNSFVYLLPAFIVFAFWLAYGSADLVHRLAGSWSNALVVVILVLIALYGLAVHFKAMDLSHDREAFDYARNVFSRVPNDGVILADGDPHLFSLWYYRYVTVRDASRVAVVSPELLQYEWYCAELKRAFPELDLRSEFNSNLAAVDDLIAHSLGKSREVYVTKRYEWLQAYIVESQGDLFQVRSHR